MIACTTVGMLEIGKMNPDRMNVGRNDDSSATWNATCCVSAIVEISSPCACAPTRNSDDRSRRAAARSRASAGRTAAIAARMMSSAETNESARYGSVLPRMNGTGADRRHPDLLHRAALLLADDRERRGDDRGDHRDVGDQAGHEEQRAAQLRVVPDARLERSAAARPRRLRAAMASAATRRAELGDERLRVAHHGRRGVGVVAVDDRPARSSAAGCRTSRSKPAGITSDGARLVWCR